MMDRRVLGSAVALHSTLASFGKYSFQVNGPRKGCQSRQHTLLATGLGTSSKPTRIIPGLCSTCLGKPVAEGGRKFLSGE